MKAVHQPFIWLVALMLLVALPIQAQELLLEPFIPVEGRIDPGGSQSWRFAAPNGAVLSFVVEALTPDFDPAFSIRSSSGAEIIANDDYNYPVSLDALLEAITIPRTDDYELVVSGSRNTAGDYRLTMLPGYSQSTGEEHFSDLSSWETSNVLLQTEVSEGQLALSLAGIGESGTVFNPASPAVADFYVETHISQIEGRNGWVTGLMLRAQDGQYYALVLNDQGFWRLLFHTPDGNRVVRDWTAHPAIRPGETRFTLGALVNGPAFEVFYNGQYVGQASDATLTEGGRVGLVAGTVDAIGSETTVRFDHLAVTIPRLIDGKPILPRELTLLYGAPMAQELQRRHMIPPGGSLVLTLPESSARDVRPGVSRFILGRGATYKNFALGARVSIQAGGAGLAGCGLIVRSVDDTHYTLAFVDQSNSYGLAERDGQRFKPGIYGQNPGWQPGSRYLLVIANGSMMHYFIDGRYMGALANAEVEGEIGNAVVNFEPIDTTCQYRETWLWRWD